MSTELQKYKNLIANMIGTQKPQFLNGLTLSQYASEKNINFKI